MSNHSVTYNLSPIAMLGYIAWHGSVLAGSDYSEDFAQAQVLSSIAAEAIYVPLALWIAALYPTSPSAETTTARKLACTLIRSLPGTFITTIVAIISFVSLSA